MRTFLILGTAMFAFSVFTGVSGCGKKDKSESSSPTVAATTTPSAVAKKEPLEGDLAGELVGVVTYDGKAPKLDPPEVVNKNKEQCQSAGVKPFELIGQEWIVDSESSAVADVLVFLKPPKGKYFRYEKELKPENKSIDQPHCAFIPHVQVLFPVYFDGSKEVETGQKLTIKYSASFPHDTNIDGVKDYSFKSTVPAHKEKDVPTLPVSDSKPAKVSCKLHTGMAAQIWALDHPYAAVTGHDGKFEIKNIPIGTELEVVFRHEDTSDQTFKIKFEKGKKTQDLKIKSKSIK
jgi:hypothetical protein